MRQVISLALKQMVLGVGDLHGGGFATLNTIFTVFYGSFIKKSNMNRMKTYQRN